MRTLLRLGGWNLVTNVVNPLLIYMDRFLIGSLVSLSAVAYYATPYDMITKLLIIPSSMAGPLFPAFAASYAQGDYNRGNLLLAARSNTRFYWCSPLLLWS